MTLPPIRLVTFDAFHTLLKPRLPIYVQYSQTFAPYLGVLEPSSIKASFKVALKQLQREKPSYNGGSEEWWSEVVKRTAIGAGGNPQGALRMLFLCSDCTDNNENRRQCLP
jgi:hypothetical protein